MILGAEIASLVFGLYMLITGRPMGKNKPGHWMYRLLGAFALTLLPVVLIFGMAFGVVLVILNPDQDPAALVDSWKWPMTGMELAIVVLYVAVLTIWEKYIARRAAAEAAVRDADAGTWQEGTPGR